MAEIIFKEEVFNIVGAAMEVHNELGSGFLEPVYQEAFEMELTDRRIPFASQAAIAIYYKGRELEKRYKADIVCYRQIIVELKSVNHLSSVEEAQILNYLKASKLRVGLLINFGTVGRLEWKRFIR